MKTDEVTQTVQRDLSRSTKDTITENNTRNKTRLTNNGNDDLFTSNLDFLILKLLNIFTINDKPVIFIFPVLLIAILNIYLGYFSKIYFALLIFFIYEWGCGNSLIGSGRDALMYGIFVMAALLVESFTVHKKND